jgi:membrane protein DedA with SNARE-associated domain
VFLARWVGALRAVVPFVAGLGRLRVATFVGWNVAASLAWASVVVLLGWGFGERVASVVDRVGLGLSAVVVLALIGAWWWRRRSGD